MKFKVLIKYLDIDKKGNRIYSRPKIPSIQRLDFSYLLERWWEKDK